MIRHAVLSLEQVDSRELMARAQTGDTHAVETLCRQWQPYIATVIARNLGDPNRVDDLTQETLIRAWRALDTCRPTGPGPSIRGWLATIARRIVIDDYRARQVRPLEATFGDPADMPAPLVDPYTQVLDRAQVATVLAPLVKEHREVLVLRHMMGLTQAEMAARLGVPLGTLKSRLYYATLHARQAAAVAAGGETR